MTTNPIKTLCTESLNGFLVDNILYISPQFVARGICVFHVTPLEYNYERLVPDFHQMSPHDHSPFTDFALFLFAVINKAYQEILYAEYSVL